MQNSVTNVRKLTGTAMLGAVAAVLMYLEFPIPIMPSFVKLDVSELPALLAAYAYGPVSGIAVCLIKNLIKLPSTSTAAVGELFNFVMGALFVGVAGFVYKRSKTAAAHSSALAPVRWSWRLSVCRTTILWFTRRMWCCTTCRWRPSSACIRPSTPVWTDFWPAC